MLNPGGNLEDARTGAKVLGLQVRPYEIKSAGDIDRAGDEIKKLRANALLIGTGSVANLNLGKIAELAAGVAAAGNVSDPAIRRGRWAHGVWG
jgi:hypothetical protein